jgi:hypothetical protein
LCQLVSEALRGPDRAVAAPPEATVRAHWLDRIDQWVWRNALKRRESYLAQATDLPDLEARLRALERDMGSRRYY